MNKILLSMMLFLSFALPGYAQESLLLEKQARHLFNPTPKNLMRDMSTDRPDRTESPYTVDAGHLQVETSVVDYSYDHESPHDGQTRMDTLSIAPTNFKIGLLNNADIQMVVNPYVHERSTEDGVVSKKRGVGAIQTRLKVNLWGNDGGVTALGIMPFIKWPTAGNEFSNDDVEGGIIVPLAVALPGEWNMGLMAEVDFNKNEADDNYHSEYIHSITFSHAIIGELSGYVEFFSLTSTEEDMPWSSTMDAGVTYALSKDIQLDMGLNIGLVSSADDLNPFCGLSMRY